MKYKEIVKRYPFQLKVRQNKKSIYHREHFRLLIKESF